jgi:hypothetical protein
VRPVRGADAAVVVAPRVAHEHKVRVRVRGAVVLHGADEGLRPAIKYVNGRDVGARGPRRTQPTPGLKSGRGGGQARVL